MAPETPNAKLNVLMVEDDPLDARLLRDQLARAAPGRFDIAHAEQLSAAMDRLAQEGFDVILLDLFLPDSQGLETLLALHKAANGNPIVVLTGLDDETVAINAVRNGAQDYLVKGQSDGHAVTRSIRYAIERAQMQEDLENSRRQQAKLKDQFLSHVSHELRMPLTVINQAIANLLTGVAGDLNAQQRECLEIAEPNVKQLRKMIDELLDAARSDAGQIRIQPQRLDLCALVVRTVESFRPSADSKGVQIARPIFSNDVPAVYADPYRVEEILLNLLDNALKFTAIAGRIRVSAHVLSGDPKFVCVAVVDTGCGISKEAQEKIFDRLHQEPQPIVTSRMGLGIGLYICKQLIAGHGGRIWVESEPGHGSAFYFTLPVYEEKFEEAPRD
jgi:signal transduction histidine kinase